MKVVVAIDSLKGSLSSLEAGEGIKLGILEVFPKANVSVKSIADGGEGTARSVTESLGGKMKDIVVKGPLGQLVTASYGVIPRKNLAVMEMAEAAGISLSLPERIKDATTFGVGEMILDAMDEGYRNFIIGIGGSGTNDGGVGMLKALGVRFLDSKGREITDDIKGIGEIDRIDIKGINPIIKECNFKVACDVDNPLCGLKGATYVYGPQKGVKLEDRDVFDNSLQHYGRKTAELIGKDYSQELGAGAAGGLGFGLISYLGASLTSGISLVLETIGLEEDIKDADLVFTGEGQLDHQTVMGKAPGGVAALAKKYGCPVIALAGSVTNEAKACHQGGIDAYFSILTEVVPLSTALDKNVALRNIITTTSELMRVLKVFNCIKQ
ncbi:MAG: glycerate kinase family protein [Filifactoraceae bacterium]